MEARGWSGWFVSGNPYVLAPHPYLHDSVLRIW
ncbi:hypothetical protein BH20CHL7_BH20CHL7_14960 [soil metagenome]